MTAYADLVHADGARCHLPLDGSSTALTDTTGGGHDATASGAGVTATTSGPIAGEGCQAFDGTAWLAVARPDAFPNLRAFSYEAWIKVTPTATRNLILWEVVSDFDGQPMVETAYGSGVGGTLGFENADGGYVGSTVAGDGAWHHVCFVTDGTDGLIYVDGVPIVLDYSYGALPFDTPAVNTDTDTPNVPTRVLLGAADGGVIPWIGHLAHAAAYPLALTPCQVLSHYDLGSTGTYTPCPEWVRLSHVSGQGYWQSRGDVTEEWAGGAKRLLLPIPTLPVAPATLVGKDPDTGLPMFCPQPEQPASGSRSIPPATGDECIPMRCGAALAMTQRLQSLYQTWQTWINAAISVVGSISIDLILNWIGAFIEALIVAERVASWLLTAFNKLKPLWAGLSGAEMGTVLPAWDTTTVDNVQRVFFCSLQCTGTEVSVSAGDMTNVAGYMRANTSDFLGNIVSELLALCCEYTALGDWQAVINGATPSSACAGYSCG